jgi:hypothetical protein
MQQQYRQGEILLVKVECPTGFNESAKYNAIILGIGETGNAHVLEAVDVRWLYEAVEDINRLNESGARGVRGRVWVDLPQGGQIIHREPSVDNRHTPMPIPPGVYAVHIDSEYLPWEDQMRQVFD